MPRIDTRDFYNAALHKHGKTTRGLHWNSEKTQLRRFEIIRSFLPDSLENVTLVDAGCGFGDFYRFLCENGESPGEYIGLDFMAPMCEEARERTGCDIRQCDILVDPLEGADYYICSGAMNILTRFETHLFIRRCYEASAKGFVFNLLEGNDSSMVYNYFRAAEIKTLGRDLGVEQMKLKRGYLERDFTAAYYKSGAV